MGGGTANSADISVTAGSYTNDTLASHLTTQINNDMNFSNVTVIWTGKSYAITHASSAISEVVVTDELDAHLKLSTLSGGKALDSEQILQVFQFFLTLKLF